MSVIIWPDLLLIVFALLALGPVLWCKVHSRRAVGPTRSRYGMSAAACLCFVLGVGCLVVAGVDVVLAEWDKAHRLNTDNRDAAFAAFFEAYRSRPIDPEVYPKPEAPDFRLPALDEDRSVRLSDFRGREPVVLIFGSFG